MEKLKPWEYAIMEFDEKEIPGVKHNKRILEYFNDIGAWWFTSDEVPWCAVFVQWCLKQAGLKYNYMANARYFLNYGTKTENPRLGDLVVLWRTSKNGTAGHVGFYIKEDKDHFWILGGNQNNKVGIDKYEKKYFLDFRRV